MKFTFMLLPQSETQFLLLCLSETYSVFRLNSKSFSMKVSFKLPPLPPTGSNHSCSVVPIPLLKEHILFFFALWSLIYQLIFPSEGKFCLSLLHKLKSKLLRLMYKTLMTWCQLPFECYVFTFSSMDSIPSYNINQSPGIPGPLRFRSLNSMADKRAKCSTGFLCLPGASHSHLACNPGNSSGYHTCCFPLCFLYVRKIKPKPLLQSIHEFGWLFSF